MKSRSVITPGVRRRSRAASGGPPRRRITSATTPTSAPVAEDGHDGQRPGRGLGLPRRCDPADPPVGAPLVAVGLLLGAAQDGLGPVGEGVDRLGGEDLAVADVQGHLDRPVRRVVQAADQPDPPGSGVGHDDVREPPGQHQGPDGEGEHDGDDRARPDPGPAACRSVTVPPGPIGPGCPDVSRSRLRSGGVAADREGVPRTSPAPVPRPATAGEVSRGRHVTDGDRAPTGVGRAWR